MSRKNTLFAYFSPKGTNSTPAPKSADDRPKKQPDEPTIARKKIKHLDSSPYAIGDIVLAKLEGHPFWPSLVCKDPATNVHCRKNNAKNPETHVQFFDEPPSHSWIKDKFVKKFNEADRENQQKSNAKLKNAFDAAKKALKLEPNDRLALVVTNFSQNNKAASMDESFELEELQDTDDEMDQKPAKVTKRKDKNQPIGSAKKKRRVVVRPDSDDSGDEYKPDENTEESDGSASEAEEEEMSLSEPESVSETLVKKNRKPAKKKIEPKVVTNHVSTPLSSLENTPSRNLEKTKAKLAAFSPSQSKTSVGESAEGEGKTWAHLTYDFLKDDKIRDAKMRPKSHPEYDPKTLHIPDSAKKNFSPAMKQWWELKSQHFDVILFFKVGKFYELYHMDAVVGVNELNLVFMKGEFAHSGFPEIAYGRYSASLVERGYRVARVEQTETPAMMEDRCKKTSRPTKFDRVVKREICQITTKGTRCYGCLDSQNSDADSAYLLAITEKSYESASGNESDYGVCFIDTSIGKFHLGQFSDDRHGSRLQTLIAHYVPVQVLYERGTLSPKTLQILKNSLSNALLDSLFPNSEFWGAEKTLKFLAEGKYFENDKNGSAAEWPETLKRMLDEGDSLGLTAKDEWKLAIKSLGACTWYLKDCFLETELLTMKNFDVYVPLDLALVETRSAAPKKDFFRGKRHMILDSITLKNLDVLQNSSRGSLEGTLLGTLDHCCTLAGKRLLRLWICSPLCSCAAINDRLDALGDLMSLADACTKSRELLKKLPDLERLLSKIHSRGNDLRSKNHPDSRAIFYDDVTYSKRKIVDFIDALKGFKTATEVIGNFQKHTGGLKSSLLKQCVTYENAEGGVSGKFPDLSAMLEYFDNAFDHDTAKKKGSIIPSKGVDPEYDEVVGELDATNKQLQKYLESQCAHFGCKVTFVGSARNRFQLEVPERHVRSVTSKYELQGQRKGFKRYWTPEVKEMLAKVLSAEDRRDAALRDIMRRIFEKFSQSYKKWDCAIQCLATLDVLLGLAHYSEFGGNTMCRPSVTLPSDDYKPFIEIRNGCHPCITRVFTGGEFIPNDTFIGTCDNADGSDDQTAASMLLVTGPNMGGKSTLMRQVGLITILAHMGCYVPAEECRLSPVDRIFTRLGASDRIMQGESTFYVELSETASILHHATKHSLVLMDELGRGTSTYDGISIAYSVVNQLTQAVRCRTLFSTHYHSLVGYFSRNRNCALGHMACLVENENEDDPTQETITFLYKFIPGACPKSYGFNAAKLAGLTEDVIRLGHKKAKELEDMVENNQIFRSFHRSCADKDELIQLISAIKI